MEATTRHRNRGGPAQGGVITALADTTTAIAFMTTLEEDESTTNIELKVNFLRPVFEDCLEAPATVVVRRRTIGLTVCEDTLGADTGNQDSSPVLTNRPVDVPIVLVKTDCDRSHSNPLTL
ncbi:PaaI family thioesterase [Natrinema sp. 1APR25-10V2]|uniref:PaaI family thioesterase n=1 Tax=Natrinema sp. 1APR25-10V2 TaxID=2951081 RepID=UPI002874E54B|nr:PaaI family thioesterase [Natrinema sp. 1APR25-10V2]MDS0477125.1 PaaI family thioesterase [Natrinema sp. 1APR25-10V2]